MMPLGLILGFTLIAIWNTNTDREYRIARKREARRVREIRRAIYA